MPIQFYDSCSVVHTPKKKKPEKNNHLLAIQIIVSSKLSKEVNYY